jgi:hypothetical protein
MERYEYLRLKGSVGQSTFGFDRVFNQMFYSSPEWRAVRNKVIVRDIGCDLGIDGHHIVYEAITIHHMNPVTIKDIESRRELLLNPEFLITTIHKTHNAIHYGDMSILEIPPIE